jgi:phage RecT family recombinase
MQASFSAAVGATTDADPFEDPFDGGEAVPVDIKEEVKQEVQPVVVKAPDFTPQEPKRKAQSKAQTKEVVKTEAESAEVALPDTTNSIGLNAAHLKRLEEKAMAAFVGNRPLVKRFIDSLDFALKQTPKLQNCSTESLGRAARKLAQIGLLPNTPLQEAFMVPIRNQGKYECEVFIGFQGLLKLAYESGVLKGCSTFPIYSSDTVVVRYGLNEVFEVTPSMDAIRRDEDIIGFGCVLQLESGKVWEYMSRAEVDSIMMSTPSARNGISPDSPWRQHYVQMGRKTVLRRTLKSVPKSPELAAAIQEEEDQGGAQ